MSTTFTQKKPNRNSLLEFIKLSFAFMVLKGHGFTPLQVYAPGYPGCQGFGSASVAVEFFFCICGWFLIKGIVSHQEKYNQLGLGRSWGKFFTKRFSAFVIPCILPGLILCVICMYYHGGSPNGILGMYGYVHEMFLVMAIYYLIYYKIKDENKRLYITIILFVVSILIRFGFRTIEILKTPLETLSAFGRGLSFISLGILCSRIPKINAHKIILGIICVISIAAAMLGVIFPIRNIGKEVIGVFTYPFVIYGCLLINFQFKPFDYLGSLSKGLYLGQMLPYTFNVVGLYYKIEGMHAGGFLLIAALVPMFLDDLIRRLYKIYRTQKPNNETSFAKIKTWGTKIYYTKGCFIALVVLAASMLAVGVGMGIYGVSIGHFKNFEGFVKNNRMTVNCSTLLTLIGLSFFPIMLSINSYIQYNAIIRGKQ